MVCSTIREILVQTAERFGKEDAVRYKVGKNEIESKSYAQLKEDSERFSGVLKSLGELGGHVAMTGRTSYQWLVAYLGTVNSGSVAVPLDVSLPAEEMCELIDRADVTVLVLDEIRSDVMAIVRQQCPKLKYLISMQKAQSDEMALSLEQLLKEQEESFAFSPEPEQLCTIMFTSGTNRKEQGSYADSSESWRKMPLVLI